MFSSFIILTINLELRIIGRVGDQEWIPSAMPEANAPVEPRV